MPKKIVLKLGGSVFAPETQNVAYIQGVSKLLSEIKNLGYQVGVVVGGGGLARSFISLAKKVGANNYMCDDIAIQMTRLNARFMISGLGAKAYPLVPVNIPEASLAMENGRVVCMGGTVPGHTTDAVSVLLAEACGGARWVKACGVDGIYAEDPRLVKKAKKFPEISTSRLVEMASLRDKRAAGENFVVDVLAAKVLHRSRISGCVVLGSDLSGLKNALLGKKHSGTEITPG